MRGSALWSGLESRQRPERSTTCTPSRNHPPPAPSSPSVRAVHAPRSSSPSAWAPPPTPTRAALLPFPRQAFRLSPVSSTSFHRGLLLLLPPHPWLGYAAGALAALGGLSGRLEGQRGARIRRSSVIPLLPLFIASVAVGQGFWES